MRRCSECGRRLDGIMAEHPDRDPFEMIAHSRVLLVAVCVLIVLGSVGFEALLVH